MSNKWHVLVAAVATAGMGALAQAEAPTGDEMWELIQKQQQEIESLKGELETTEAKVEATADAVDSSSGGGFQNTSIGGYGELHYNNLDVDGGSDKKEMDIHRFVLFIGHKFSDSVRFYSELEVEHDIAGEGKPGEVELEQAFIEWSYADHQRLNAGVFLLPVGIMNETHEPDTFYGVERNSVEKNIIPATWWEGGVLFSGEIAPGLNYDAGIHSGLYLDDTHKIRSGRQKVGKAKADDLAVTARIKYTGVAGLELAVTVQQQSDLTQGTVTGEISATLIETHAVYQTGPFGVRALYATWNIDDEINAIKDGADEQTGYYLEGSYKITPQLGVFLRASEWDNSAGASSSTETEQVDIGLNYWLTDNVVFKIDYQDQDKESGENDGFNLGVGWSF